MEETKKNVDEELDEELEDEDNIDDTDLDEDDLEDDEDDKKSSDEEDDKKFKKESKKPQSRQENAKYAALRKRNKELESKVSDLEVKVTKADFNAEKKVIRQSTLDDLGLDSIEDEDDLLLCKEYEKAEKRGSDNPIKDANMAYRKAMREKQAKASEQEVKDRELKEAVAKDSKDFYETYKITPAQALQDEDFVEAYGDLIEAGNLTKLYGKYKALTKSKDVEDDQDSKVAKKMGTIPTSSKQTKKQETLLDLDGDKFLEAFRKKYN